jgi:hypothetical protein
MKKILFLLLISSALQAQVTIPVDSITVGGISFRASATFECMIWNTRTKSVALQWVLQVHGRDSSLVASKAIEQVADNSSYVYQDGSITTDEVIFDSTKNYHVSGIEMVIPEYEFYDLIAKNGAGGATIYQLIQTAGLRRKYIFKL